MAEEFERQDDGETVAYAIAGEYDYGFAKLTPSQAKRLLSWLHAQEQQIEQDIQREQAWNKLHGRIAWGEWDKEGDDGTL
jgi:hypothetical protein